MSAGRYYRFLLRTLLLTAGILWGLCWLAVHCQAQTGLARTRQLNHEKAMVGMLRTMMNIRETAGNNRSLQIDALTRAGGGQLGWPWCGYTQGHVQRARVLPVPKGFGAATNWFPMADALRTYYVVGVRGKLDSIRLGHPVGFRYGGGRIAHVSRVASVEKPLRAGRGPRGFYCIGGNEGVGINAGVHLTFYPASSIHAAANWSY